MLFLLGTHKPQWLAQVTVPLFVSRRRLQDRRTLPRATCDWVMDSGGFTELDRGGAWSISEAEFVEQVRRYQEEIGRLLWAPVMDYMCEPWIVEKTGLSVREHQRRTLVSYLSLRDRAPEIPWAPVLQGWEADDYQRHRDDYEAAGVDLAGLSIVGVGSVCRRQHTDDAEAIVRLFPDLNLHGFGFKITGLARCADALASADSMSWSLQARYRPRFCADGKHQNCANCLTWALHWREKVEAGLRCPAPHQLRLF